jgi:hypothetical protein
MRQISMVCTVVFLSVVGLAQNTPEWEVHGGYQFTRFDIGAVQDAADSVTTPNNLPRVNIGRNLDMSGGTFSLQQNANSWWGGILDFSTIYASKHIDLSQQAAGLGLVTPGTNVSATFRPTIIIFGGGPQFTYRKRDKLQPFVRVMAGIAHADLKPDALTKADLFAFAPTFKTDDNSLALIAGGGVDYVWKPYLAIRVAADYVRTYLFSEHQGNLRMTAGLSFRLGRR